MSKIINFPNKLISKSNDTNKNIVLNINKMLLKTQTETMCIEDIVNNAPFVLVSHVVLRKILRCIKRTHNIEASINNYVSESCPPNMHQHEIEGNCDSTCCNQCWLTFIQNYMNNIKINE